MGKVLLFTVTPVDLQEESETNAGCFPSLFLYEPVYTVHIDDHETLLEESD